MVRRAFRGHRSRLDDRRTHARRLFRYRDRAGDEHLHRPRWAGWIRRRHRGGDPRAHGKHDIPPLRAHLTRHREHPRHRRRRHAHRERTRRIFCGSDRLQHQPLLRQPHPRHRLRNGHESHRQPPLLRMVQGRLRHRSRRQRADRGLCGGACRHHRQRERREDLGARIHRRRTSLGGRQHATHLHRRRGHHGGDGVSALLIILRHSARKGERTRQIQSRGSDPRAIRLHTSRRSSALLGHRRALGAGRRRGHRRHAQLRCGDRLRRHSPRRRGLHPRAPHRRGAASRPASSPPYA